MMMSIDQSLSCSGIHIWGKDGHDSLYVIKTKPKDEVILRIREIMVQLKALIKVHKIKTVVIESLPFGLNSSSVRPLAALYYCIQNMCIDSEVKFAESNVTAVKKLATGSGKAKKEDMIAAFEAQAPEAYSFAVRAGYKKTTGLADLADGYFIGLKYIKDKEEE